MTLIIHNKLHKMNRERLLGKKVIIRNVHCIDTINGIITENYKDVTGILEKIGSNDFFGWKLSATLNGSSYELKTLSQIQPIYK